MFIKNKSDVDLYAKKIYAYIISSKSKEYVEFVQKLLKIKIEDAINIVIADIHDYFCEHVNSCESMYIYENLSVREINESEYINDIAFFRYVNESFSTSTKEMNLYFILKYILLKLFDVNVNILYALQSKNKDANAHVKYIIAKYTNANIKITRNVASKLCHKVNRSISLHEFLLLYEKYVENQIEKFETETITKEEIKLTNTDLLVYYYFMSFSKCFVKTKIEEIARDCKISTATVSRAIRKLVQAQKIKVHKKNNRNIYEIIDYKIIDYKEKQQKEYSKVDISKSERNVKDIEIQTSESDYRKYKRNEKIDPETRYKLYLYRMKYREELENTKLKRLTKDDVLFFLINTENLMQNESLTLKQVLKIIKYADSNPRIKNPVGWLIARFMIGRGRFYFLLQKSKQNEKQEVTISKKYEYQKQENAKPNKYVYINEDLLYFAKKYNIPESDILSYLRKLKNLYGDNVSYIVEIYLANRLWKDSLSREEKQELISYAKRQISKFIVPPKPEEVKNTIKSIILGEIRSRYLTLSIEEKIKMKNASQCYDTS
ncbi:hypothetical protein GWK41_09960 [Persephonella atlantica]|uniref:Helix-turn-helix type 11 domain-containing protein n=1 Tax=Persephonella atlantica TaxID=2699429 RepID=A0ABS1GKC6_9AQUI|nr:helix-turn-helix domain-containing protein [Persephonella atlantica]MBK3333388.1 hypothetical protein [Persephonella atlantica]